jgi:hypothetical protein
MQQEYSIIVQARKKNMPTFQVVARTIPKTVPPQKQRRRLSEGWLLFVQIQTAMLISAGLFVLILTIKTPLHDYLFSFYRFFCITLSHSTCENPVLHTWG